VKSFNVWIRPAVFLSVWIATTSFTLSELATVGPVLRSIPTQQQRTAWDAKARTVGARAQVVAR
jgi:hypothetical protein